MKMRPKDLEKEGYVQMSQLPHDDLIPFLKDSFKTKSSVIRWFNALNIFLLLLIAGFFIRDYLLEAEFSWGVRFGYLSLGLLLSLLVIPVHELLHALAYKYVGAKRTSYDANLKKFYFMAMADQFVASYREFRIVALAPLVVITVAGLVLLTLPIGFWKYAILAFLLTHSLFSSGDIALLNYFEVHKDKQLVTYDDKAARMSYFYQKHIQTAND